MTKCINCNDIELKNPKAQYCSDKCRMAFKRKAIKLNERVFGSQPEQRTRTEHNPNEVSDTPDVIPRTSASMGLGLAAACDAARDAQEKPERGKDIKCFADLSPSVQQTINTLSDDKTEHKRRTAIAINYQHQFPDRYHSVGVQ